MAYSKKSFSGQPKPASLMDVVGTKNDGFLEPDSNESQHLIYLYETLARQREELDNLKQRVSRLEQPCHHVVNFANEFGTKYTVEVDHHPLNDDHPPMPTVEEVKAGKESDTATDQTEWQRAWHEGGVPNEDIVRRELCALFERHNVKWPLTLTTSVLGYLTEKGLLK